MNDTKIQITERLLNRVRDYVARELLAGRQTTVEEVLERALQTIKAVKEQRR